MTSVMSAPKNVFAIQLTVSKKQNETLPKSVKLVLFFLGLNGVEISDAELSSSSELDEGSFFYTLLALRLLVLLFLLSSSAYVAFVLLELFR